MNRVHCLARAGRPEQALAALDVVKGSGSDEAEAWYTSPFVRLLQGDTAAACADGRRSLEWPFKDAEAERARRAFMDRFRR